MEERGEPKTRHQLERMHAVFRNTLLMCVLSFPQFGQFDITGRTWRAGTSGSMVRTSGAVFPRQRTTSWQLPSATHGGRFTRRCMRATPSMRPCCRSGRTLFWTREVYEKIKTFSSSRLLGWVPDFSHGGEWPCGGSRPRPLGGSLGFPGKCPGAASDTAMALARPAIISQGYLLRVEDSLVPTCD